MKTALKSLGLSALIWLLGNESLHSHMRSFALKTSNKFDDAAIEGLIITMKSIAKNLKAL